jgi:hypothetical protein
LRDAIEEILADVATCPESWEEACWLHSDVRVRNNSQNEPGQEVCGKSSHCKALCTLLINNHDLIAHDWMHKSNGEHVCEARRPELVETVEESSVCIANTPEPEGGKEVNEVFLGQVSILFVLF